jgi:integrase
LFTDDPAAYLFSPRLAVAELHAKRTANRKTPKYPSHMKRNATVKQSKPKRKPAGKYTVTAYDHAVARAAKRAGVPHWAPIQLRHTFATEVREDHGLEAAQVLLGHSRADVTQIYAERNEALAVKIAAQIG